MLGVLRLVLLSLHRHGTRVGITRDTAFGKAHIPYPLPLSRWALDTCPRKRNEIKTNCSSHRASTTTRPYAPGLASELRICLPHFGWPPPQLASPIANSPLSCVHIRQPLPPGPLPQSLLGNPHFPHTFPSIRPMRVILSMGPTGPLLDLNSRSVLVLEDAMCGIWSQSQALASGQSPALYRQGYCVRGFEDILGTQTFLLRGLESPKRMSE